MADTTTTVYGLTKPEVGASEDTWGTKLNTNLDALDDLLSGSTTLQGAKLDDTTKIVDNADATKIVALSAGSLTTATTRTFTFPDATGTFVLADNTATLTNKTLTSPAIVTGFTFDGTTVTALSGADTTVVTGTAGTSGNVATWNADGDVVDGGIVPSAGAMVFIESQDASTSAALNFTGFDDTKYDSYVFEGANLVPDTGGVAFSIQTSADAGSSYASGITDYSYAMYLMDMLDAEGTENAASTDTLRIAMTDNLGADDTPSITGDGFGFTLKLRAPHLVKYTMVGWQGEYECGAKWRSVTGGGVRLASEAVDAVRFVYSSGNITSGTITMYGLRNS